MTLHCVVCIKQVPDTKRITGEAMKEDGTVNRAALPAICNPEDLHALEAALALRDAHGGTVTALTMGAPMAGEVLREALYRTADRAVLLTDRRAAASDTLATSYILAGAVRKLQPDVVFCGRQAIDGDTAQVGPQMAEKLEMPAVTYVDELLGLDGRTLTLRRNVGNGWERVSCELPVVLTVLDGANHPRPRSLKRMMKYKKAQAPAGVEAAVRRDMPEADDAARADEVARRCEALRARGLLLEQWSLDELELDLAWCGAADSPTKVHRIQSVVLTGGAYKEFPGTDEGAGQLVSELIEDHTIG